MAWDVTNIAVYKGRYEESSGGEKTKDYIRFLLPGVISYYNVEPFYLREELLDLGIR